MDTIEAIEIIEKTKCQVIEGDKEKFEEAIFSLGLNAYKHTEVTAEWVYVCDTPFFEYIYQCSNCGREQRSSTLTIYCGDCGRKMKVKK